MSAEVQQVRQATSRSWVAGPVAVARRWQALGAVAVDGWPLAGLRSLGGLLGPLAGLAAAVVTALGLGGPITIAQTPWLLALMIAVAIVAGQLGLWLLAGLVIGDAIFTVVALETIAPLWQVGVARLGGLVLLAAGLVAVPAFGRGLAATVTTRLEPRSPQVDSAIAVAALAATTAALAWVWARLWSVVGAPLFVTATDPDMVLPYDQFLVAWRISPPMGGMSGVGVVACAALAGVAVRAALTAGLASHEPARRRLATVEADLEESWPHPTPSRPSRRRRVTYVVLAGGIAAVTLPGLAWGRPGALAVLIVAAMAACAAAVGLVPLPSRRWRQAMARVPLLARLAIVVLVVDQVSRAVSSLVVTGPEQMPWTTAVAIVVGLLVVVVALAPADALHRSSGPGVPSSTPRPEHRPAPPPPTTPPPTASPRPAASRLVLRAGLVSVPLVVVTVGFLLLGTAEAACAQVLLLNCDVPIPPGNLSADAGLAGAGLGLAMMGPRIVPVLGGVRWFYRGSSDRDEADDEQAWGERLLAPVPGNGLVTAGGTTMVIGRRRVTDPSGRDAADRPGGGAGGRGRRDTNADDDGAGANRPYHDLRAGEWRPRSSPMDQHAATYLEQITRRRWDEAFVIDEVEFGGVERAKVDPGEAGTSHLHRGRLLDFQGPGLDERLDATRVGADEVWRTTEDLREKARRQALVAGDVPIIWHVAEAEAANKVGHLLRDLSIEVMHTPAAK